MRIIEPFAERYNSWAVWNARVDIAPEGALVRRAAATNNSPPRAPCDSSELVVNAVSFVDTFWIGRYIGVDALARGAAGSIFWIWLIISIGEIVSVGISAVAARRHP